MSASSERLGQLPPGDRRALLSQLLQQKSRRAGTFPLSFVQERLWFLDQLMPGNPFVNIATTQWLRFALNVAALERSLNDIVQRHEALRTSFAMVEGAPVQVVAPALKLPLTVVDLQGLPPAEREAEALRLATEEARRPFDLGQGPLVRTTLYQLHGAEYLFLLVMHHIVSDGWSMGIFGRELAALYPAHAAGRAVSLPELPIQYADFAVWQREWLRGAVLEEQLSYWKTRLANLPVLELPGDHPRPPVQSFRGVKRAVALPLSLSTALQSLSQREGVTLFMTLLAAFSVLLARYTRQEDIVVGTYIAGRNRAELEGLIGFFVNTLILRTDLSGAPTFRELLARVREVAVGAYAHQEMPFPRLVEELKVERDLSRNPLFQVVFQLFNAPTTGGAPDAAPSPEVELGTSVFDLVCSLRETPGGLEGEFEYSSDLFEKATIERMVGHFRTLLEGIVAAPSRRLSELPLLTPPERQQLLVEWNATGRPGRFEHSLIRRFERRAAQRPEATAFTYEGRALSYRELNQRANQLARFLRSLGVGGEQLVGVCLERSLSAPLALLAIFKVGGVYLPLDPSYPRERLTYVVEDARAGLVLTERRFAEVFAGRGLRVVCLDEMEAALAAEPDGNLPDDVAANQPAYAIYTSGSTGRPKGVLVEHLQILNRLDWMAEAYPHAPDEVACQKTALNFVDSLWELLGPLLEGIPTVIVPEAVGRDPLALVRLLADARVTRIWLVPTLLRQLLESYSDLQRRLPALRYWVTSGEELSPVLFQRFQELMPDAVLYNLYGTSEVWDATWFDPEAPHSPWSHVPIGRPISNVEVYVLDDVFQAVPVGVTGELYVGGLGLARGYLNRPALTAEKFIPHPFSTEPGGRLYRTGDLVRYLPDGNLEFLGRRDHQVKVRGYRIELGEIEALLGSHPGVKEAVVVLHEQADDARLVAYLRAGVEPAPAVEALRRFLQAQLPEYMLPAAFVFLDAFPLTPSGKVERRALARRAVARAAAARGYVAPRTAVEKQLAELFATILGLDRVGVDDHFFSDLGGHSLLATRCVARIRTAFQVELPLRAFFEAPTVADLAVEIVRRRAEQVDTQALARMLAEIGELSEDETRTLLAGEERREE